VSDEVPLQEEMKLTMLGMVVFSLVPGNEIDYSGSG
jgi:hypothetical protein